MKLLAFLAVLALAGLQAPHAQAQGRQSITSQDWAAYKQRFMMADGRIVDDGNGGISHSEGQGYGMWLAYLAGSKSDFELIWSFTRNELLLRDDGLAAWKWDPEARPHVSDVNNATDGDILIAYALALAGDTWQQPDLTHTATDMVKAISAHLLIERNGQLLLLPGASGFAVEDRQDGPVVNLSYWVFEAFPVFARLDPDTDWTAVSRSGMELVRTLTTGTALPPEWISLATRPKPARSFDPEFSYNAFRIPLYLARADLVAGDLLRDLARKMSSDAGVAIKDLAKDGVKEVLSDAGYRIIPALARCKADGEPVSDDLKHFSPTLYYPSTLHLLALAQLNSLEACR